MTPEITKTAASEIVRTSALLTSAPAIIITNITTNTTVSKYEIYWVSSDNRREANI